MQQPQEQQEGVAGQENEQITMITSIVQRLKESPYYVRYAELNDIMEKGEQVERYIEALENEIQQIQTQIKVRGNNARQHQQFVQNQPQFANRQFQDGEHYAYQHQYPNPQPTQPMYPQQQQQQQLHQRQQQLPPNMMRQQQQLYPQPPPQQQGRVSPQFAQRTQQSYMDGDDGGDDGSQGYDPARDIKNIFDDSGVDYGLNGEDVKFEGLPEFEDDNPPQPPQQQQRR